MFEEHLLEAAAALLLLSNTPPKDRQTVTKNRRLTAHPLPPAAWPMKNTGNALSVFTPIWGFRSRRSRYMGKSKGGQKNGPSSSAAVPAPCSHWSPDTPIDLVNESNPSTSGSDGFVSSSEIPPLKRFRAGVPSAPPCDTSIKIHLSAVDETASVEAVVTSLQPIIRQGRKKTLSDLHAEERLLVEEKEKLVKLLESRRIDRETLLTENRRLLSLLTNSQKAPAEAEPVKPIVLLPDLNEPAPENLEPDCNDN